MCAPRRLDVGRLAGCGKQVVFTMQAVTSWALLCAHLCLFHQYSYPCVFKMVSIESKRSECAKHEDHSAYVLF